MVSVREAARNPMPTNELKGVRGWLFLFCLSMTIRPILTIYTLIEILPVFNHPEYPRWILLLYYGLSLMIAGFGFYSAFLLWASDKKAVRVTKVYLFAMLAYWVVVALFPFLFSEDLQESPLVKFFRVLQHSLYTAVIYFAVWFAYISKSQRVANTYAADNSIYSAKQ